MKACPIFFFLIHISCISSPLSPRDPGELTDQQSQSEPSLAPLTIIAIDVGQGDATLMITPSGKTLLIDGGPEESGRKRILPLFLQLGLTRLDYMMVSHYDADHIGGIPEVIRGEDGLSGTEDDLIPQHILDRGGSPDPTTPYFDSYIQATGVLRTTLYPGYIIDTRDGLTIHCLVVNGELSDGSKIPLSPDDENGHAAGLLIRYGNFTYLTAGDLPGGGRSGSAWTVNLEDKLAPLAGAVDVLHVNHHGSQTSSSPFFLQTINPTVALISTGNGNRYGHPSPVALSRLIHAGANIYQTERGEGGAAPEVRIVGDSIFILVAADGGYSVDGDEYEVR